MNKSTIYIIEFPFGIMNVGIKNLKENKILQKFREERVALGAISTPQAL